MAQLRPRDLASQGLHQRGRQHGESVLATLGVADRQLATLEVDIFDAEAETFHQSERGDAYFALMPNPDSERELSEHSPL